MCGKIPPIEARERRVAHEEIRVRQLQGLVDISKQIEGNSERTRALQGDLEVAESIIKFLRFE